MTSDLDTSESASLLEYPLEYQAHQGRAVPYVPLKTKTDANYSNIYCLHTVNDYQIICYITVNIVI